MALQGSLTERNLYLTLAGLPAVDIDPGDVVCEYRKTAQPAFVTKTLDSSTWVNLGGGYYVLKFLPSETDTVGDFIYRLTSVEFDNFTNEQFEIDPVPEGLVVPPPDICIVTGFIKTIAGETPALTRILARPVEFPSKYGLNILNADKIVAIPDYSGQFQLKLVRGSVVVVEIERAAIRHQITVPDAPTANLIDLLPPFPIDIVV